MPQFVPPKPPRGELHLSGTATAVVQALQQLVRVDVAKSVALEIKVRPVGMRYGWDDYRLPAISGGDASAAYEMLQRLVMQGRITGDQERDYFTLLQDIALLTK